MALLESRAKLISPTLAQGNFERLEFPHVAGVGYRIRQVVFSATMGTNGFVETGITHDLVPGSITSTAAFRALDYWLYVVLARGSTDNVVVPIPEPGFLVAADQNFAIFPTTSVQLVSITAYYERVRLTAQEWARVTQLRSREQ